MVNQTLTQPPNPISYEKIASKDEFDLRMNGLLQLRLGYCVETGVTLSEEDIDEITQGVKSSFNDYSTIFMARDKTKNIDIGYLIFSRQYEKENAALLAESFVDPLYRRKGVFTRLVKESEQLASTLGLRYLRAYPWTDGNSIPALEKQGYTFIRDNMIGDCMIKEIRSWVESERPSQLET